MEGKNKNIIAGLMQLLAAFVALVLIRNEIIFTFAIIILLLINFKADYHKNEWGLFLIGCIFGLIIEVVLGGIYRLQYWQQGSLFGVPIWLPIVWGYGFVIIRRIGNLIVKS